MVEKEKSLLVVPKKRIYLTPKQSKKKQSLIIQITLLLQKNSFQNKIELID